MDMLEEQIYNNLVAQGFNDEDAKFLARMYVKQLFEHR